MTLAEFLLARITEDENRARQTNTITLVTGVNYVEYDPTHVIAECQAKRRIVMMQAANDENRYLLGFHYKAQVIENVLRLLALPYADHPDYQEGWRPPALL